ncbi:MAG: hypothetical protein PHF44_03300 [Candidatus Pacebacteria bacterium]|nr:hypothetical protein [Candidatus Paceibacterota bacterium]
MKTKKPLIHCLPVLSAIIFFAITIPIHEFGHFIMGRILFGTGGKVIFETTSAYYFAPPKIISSLDPIVSLAGGWVAGIVLFFLYFLFSKIKKYKIFMQGVSFGIAAATMGSFLYGFAEEISSLLRRDIASFFYSNLTALVLFFLVLILALLRKEVFAWVEQVLSSD